MFPVTVSHRYFKPTFLESFPFPPPPTVRYIRPGEDENIRWSGEVMRIAVMGKYLINKTKHKPPLTVEHPKMSGNSVMINRLVFKDTVENNY